MPFKESTYNISECSHEIARKCTENGDCDENDNVWKH